MTKRRPRNTIAKDALAQVASVWEPALPAGCIVPGMYVFSHNIACASVNGRALLFIMGRQLPDVDATSGKITVQWFVPPFAQDVAFKKGPRHIS